MVCSSQERLDGPAYGRPINRHYQGIKNLLVFEKKSRDLREGDSKSEVKARVRKYEAASRCPDIRMG